MLYKTILTYLPTDVKEKLREVLSVDAMEAKENTGDRKLRRIFKVGNVKTSGKDQEDDSKVLTSSRKRGATFEDDEG